jgi:hypothetical protein
VGTFAVLVILRWGDQIVRVERWTGDGPAPLGLDLRLDARGSPCLAGTRLERGMPIEVALGDGLAPYRSDHRTALAARVELVALCRRAGPSAKWRPMTAVLGALAFHSVLALSAFAHPTLAPDDGSIDHVFTVDLPVRVLYARPIDEYGDVRERHADESACVDPGCLENAAVRPAPLAEFWWQRSDHGCVPVRRVHIVVENETLTSIAATYGIGDFRAIYNEAINEALVALRPDPNRIFPGDEVNIPGEGLCASF